MPGTPSDEGYSLSERPPEQIEPGVLPKREEQNIVILNTDGTKVNVPIAEIRELLKRHSNSLRAELNYDLFVKKGLMGDICFACHFLGIPTTNVQLENLIKAIELHNEKVIIRLVDRYYDKAKKDYTQIRDLAREFNVKIEWDHMDWNKYALELSKKTKGGFESEADNETL